MYESDPAKLYKEEPQGRSQLFTKCLQGSGKNFALW